MDFRNAPLILLRIFIGWHFLYEGFAKLTTPGWTAAGYLQSATGPLASLFQALAAKTALLGVIDALNIYGLCAIGFALMLGVAVRHASLAGIALLALYYLAAPPLFTPFAATQAEGAYLIVNKNIIELFALAVILAFPASHAGLGSWWRTQRPASPQRRQALAELAGVPVFGAFLLALLRKHGYRSFEETNLTRRPAPDQFTASPTVKTFQFTSRSALTGPMPTAPIKNLQVSRMIMGGNLIGGWAHARDLIYVSKLVRAYHHKQKIFETLALAESCGVNTLITNPALCGVLNDYWRQGGHIQFISDCGNKDLLGAIRKSIDSGAAACYIQGALADELVAKGQFDLMDAALTLIRRNHLPAGIGAHKLATVQKAADMGLRPDFWMKTLHDTSYWSARPGEKECDNIWCDDPQGTIDFMQSRPEPWIAFKVLAAGALQPKTAFRHAFESGADFICVGMYDFQIVEDVNLAVQTLRGPLVRQRLWKA